MIGWGLFDRLSTTICFTVNNEKGSGRHLWVFGAFDLCWVGARIVVI